MMTLKYKIKGKLKNILLMVMAIGIIATCVGCNENSYNGLIYGSSDYEAINPALYEHGEINSLLFLGLTEHGKNNEILPGAASSWRYDENTYTYTFKLREDLTFHDGESLTARDVKFTIEAVQNPKNMSENASNFNTVEEINIIDDYTIEIKLKEANTAILDYLTIGILPAHILEGENLVTSSFNQNPVGAGPYKLVKWDIGRSIEMTSFDDYYKGTPKIKNVVFKIVKDNEAKALQLLSGELDLAQVSPNLIKKFDGQSGFDVYRFETSDYRGILYNFNSKFFNQHRELPKILSYAIDREAIVDGILLGYGESAYSPLQKSKFCNKDVENYEYNPNKTVKMLEDNGWEKGKDGYYYKNGQQLAFEICNGEGDSVRIDMSNACAQEFQKIGINATVKVSPVVDWENQDTYLIGWGSPFDEDDHTYKVFVTGEAANYGSYSNENVDKILKEARGTTDGKAKEQLYKEFQKELADNPAYTLISYLDAIYVAKDKISGIDEDAILGHHGVGIFYNIWEWELVE